VKLEFPDSQRYSPFEIEIATTAPLKLLFEEFTFQVPFQSGEGARHPNVATNTQKTAQLNHALPIVYCP
jgi:hypothetical protein